MAIELLGCTPNQYNSYLSGLFQHQPPHPESGIIMSFANHGMWHVDHVKPIKSFDFVNDDEAYLKAFNYRNTQPLWARENLSKGNCDTIILYFLTY